MFFSYSAAFLFVFGIVTSLATVDLDSPEPNLLLPDSSVEDALNSHIPLTPAADVTAWNDVLASGTADGTTDGAGIFDPDNDPIINSADTECMTDTINGRRRVRRSSDWCTVPVPVPPDTKNNPLRKPQSGSDTNKSPVLRDPTRNSAGQNAGKQNQNQDTPQISSPSPEINLPVYTPSLDYKEPLEDATMCDTARYGDSNIPMCDAGFIMNIVGIPRKMGVMYRFQNGRQYARLMKAHPWSPFYYCLEPEETWCCGKVTVEGPDRNLMHDLDHLRLYTADLCLPWPFVPPPDENLVPVPDPVPNL